MTVFCAINLQCCFLVALRAMSKLGSVVVEFGGSLGHPCDIKFSLRGSLGHVSSTVLT